MSSISKFLLHKSLEGKKATYLAFANFLANKAFCPRPAAAPFVVIPGTILADINRSVSHTAFLWHDPKIRDRDRHKYNSQGCAHIPLYAFSPHTCHIHPPDTQTHPSAHQLPPLTRIQSKDRRTYSSTLPTVSQV